MYSPNAVRSVNLPVERFSSAQTIKPLSVSKEILLGVLVQAHFPKQTGSIVFDFWLKKENVRPPELIT